MRYLSESWIDAVNVACRHATEPAPVDRLVIDQHVEGVVSYRVCLARQGSSVTLLAPTADQAEIDTPDVVFHQDLETARAVAQGSTDAHQAFLLGHIRFDGDIDLLIARRDALAWLEAVLAPVMHATTFG